MTKHEIRKEIAKKLSSQKESEKKKKDEIIKGKLLSLQEFKTAGTIAFYVSFASEVDTKALIDEALATGKRVVVPVIVEDNLEMCEIESREADLAEGPCGILQPDKCRNKPFPKDQIDLIIVPGVAFSKAGARLGRGRGFYDRFLKSLPRRIKRIGLAYDLQIIEDLPTTPHDIPVDVVITN
jgi:5-formyltetrahydrofolate cyclo-ligase